MAAYKKIFFLGGGVWGGVLEGPSFHFPNPPLEAGGRGKANQKQRRNPKNGKGDTVARGHDGRSTLQVVPRSGAGPA